MVYWETIDRSAGAVDLRAWMGLLVLRLRGEGVIDKEPRVVRFDPASGDIAHASALPAEVIHGCGGVDCSPSDTAQPEHAAA